MGMKRLLLMFIAVMFLTAPMAAMSGGTAGAQSQGLKLRDLSGNIIDLTSFAQSNNKPMLLFFWTSWCPYCMKEIKTINQYSQRFGNSVALFAVNGGESRNIVERVARNYNLEVRVLLDEQGQAIEAFGIIGVPTFILIDQQGKVVFKDNSFPEAQLRALTQK
jgi:thiol-disulfide isomerase/thioredoxin